MHPLDIAEERREQRRAERENGARCTRALVKRQRRRGTRLDESDAKRRSEDAEACRLNEKGGEVRGKKTEKERERTRVLYVHKHAHDLNQETSKR